MRPTIYKKTMNKVLFVRVPFKMLKNLDILLKQERLSRPGENISRADIVRAIIETHFDKIGEERI